MQTNLSESQDIFLEEMAGLVAMMKETLVIHRHIAARYDDITKTLARLEDKLDNLDRQLTKHEDCS